MKTYFIPRKPTTIEQAIARRAAAQGSVDRAMSAHEADYNGHYNTLAWNEYRQYYVGEYTWAGRNVFFRGTNFAEALRASKAEFNRQGAGALLRVCPNTEADEALVKADFDFVTEEEAELVYQEALTWKHKYVSEIVDYMGHVNYQKRDILLTSGTEQEYLTRVSEVPRDKAREAKLERLLTKSLKD